MPLPAALLARLQKRGIVKQSKRPETGPEEEVIAEDYDDHPQTEESAFEEEQIVPTQAQAAHTPYDPKSPAPNCPNKYSLYHICSPYCFENWLPRQPSPGTTRKRKIMLSRYPLPEDWQECFDPGLGRHYYWSTLTDEVSWLPPDHPRAKVSLPASKLRAIVKAAEREEEDEDESTEDEDEEEDVKDEDDEEETEKPSGDKRDRTSHRRSYHPENRLPRGGSRREPELDPMDPASYGECGRGTWSTGLSRKGEAKTGADTTASGPLYQMRPYPSPGAILRMNAENTKPPSSK